VKLHMGGQLDLEERAEIDIEDLKRYVAYARTQC